MFKRLLRSAGLAAGRRDFENYLLALEGASDEETAVLLLAAQWARVKLEAGGDLPLNFLLIPFSHSAKDVATAQWALNRTIKRLQSESNEMAAAGLIVWLHVLRAVSYPELRLQGRRLWGILARGMPEAKRRATRAAQEDPSPLRLRLAAEIDAIPDGLEPRDSAGREFIPGQPGAVVASASLMDGGAAPVVALAPEPNRSPQDPSAVPTSRPVSAPIHQVAATERSEPRLSDTVAESNLDPARSLDDLARRIEAARMKQSARDR